MIVFVILQHLFNKHMVVHESLVSDEEQFHCDSCEVNFHLPSAMIYHNKFFHRQDMELLAIGHSKKQKLIKEVNYLYTLLYLDACSWPLNWLKIYADDRSNLNVLFYEECALLNTNKLDTWNLIVSHIHAHGIHRFTQVTTFLNWQNLLSYHVT